jgi:hypothetical protein
MGIKQLWVREWSDGINGVWPGRLFTKFLEENCIGLFPTCLLKMKPKAGLLCGIKKKNKGPNMLFKSIVNPHGLELMC